MENESIIQQSSELIFIGVCLYLGVGVSSGKTPNVIYLSNPTDPTLCSRLEWHLDLQAHGSMG